MHFDQLIMRVAIPIETKVRELDGKLWLGINLVSRGHEVVIGPSRQIKPTLHRSLPDIYISKDVGDRNSVSFFPYLREAGVKVCGLYTEGGVTGSIERWSSNKRDVVNYLDALFTWGDAHAKEICHHYDHPEGVFVTGNPRFDLLRPELRCFYEAKGSQFREIYEDFVLVNTNFGGVNSFNRSADESASKRDSSPQDADKIIHEKRILYAFIEAILYLQAEFPDLYIIVRPHPGEDRQLYKNIFSSHNRIHVKNTGDVRSWIAAANIVVHADCTTGIESALMEQPVISYRPLASESAQPSLPQVVSKSAFDRDKLGSIVNRYIHSVDSYQLSNDMRHALRPYFHNIDSLAVKQMCDAIEQIEMDSSPSRSRLKPDIVSRTKYRIRAGLMGDYITTVYDQIREISDGGNHQEQRKKAFQKFPQLSKSEIIKRGSKLVEIAGLESFNVRHLSGTRDSYIIKPT